MCKGTGGRFAVPFLNGAGAKIEGAGSKTIRIEGVKKLCSTEFSIDADRIVAGTCLIGVLAAGGEAFLRQAPTGQLTAVIAVAKKWAHRLSRIQKDCW